MLVIIIVKLDCVSQLWHLQSVRYASRRLNYNILAWLGQNASPSLRVQKNPVF